MSYWGTVWAAVQGRKLNLTDGELYQALSGGESWSGESVSPQGALQLAAFWACARLISQTIATLPIGVFQTGPDGERIARKDHPLYRLLHDTPNADQTAVEFWEGRSLGLCTHGNGYAEKVYSGPRLTALDRMPADTWVQRRSDGALAYSFYDRGKRYELPEDKVFHIRGFGDDYIGLSPVTYARHTLGLATSTDKAAGQVYAKGLRSKGFFTFPKSLNPEQRAQAQKNFADRYSAQDAPAVGILEGGVKFEQVSINPVDAELILSRKLNVEDICRWLGVPPILIGHAAEGQTMWGTGIEQIMLGWLTLGLRPYLTRIEQAAKKRLLTAAERAEGLYIEFNVEGLLRADSKGRAELYSKMFQMAGITPNQIADRENFPRFPGGDQRFVNATFVPLEMAGKVRTSPAPPADREEPEQ